MSNNNSIWTTSFVFLDGVFAGEADRQEQSDTLQISSLKEIVDLRDKLEDYLLTTQPPEYAKETAEFIKTLAEVMEEKKMNKRIEEML